MRSLFCFFVFLFFVAPREVSSKMPIEEEHSLPATYVIRFAPDIDVSKGSIDSFWIHKIACEGLKMRLCERADALGCELVWVEHPLLDDPVELIVSEEPKQERLANLLLEVEDIKDKGMKRAECQLVKQLYIDWLQKKQEGLNKDSKEVSCQIQAFMKGNFPEMKAEQFIQESLELLKEMPDWAVKDVTFFLFATFNCEAELKGDKASADFQDVSFEPSKEAMAGWQKEKKLLAAPVVLCKGKEYVNEIGEVIIVPDDDDDMGKDSVDPFKTLLLHENEKRILQKLISDMAEKSWTTLAKNAKEMESLGAQVRHVHPLRSAAFIYSDPYLKECMKKIYQSSVPLKWSKFVKDYSDSMKTQAARNNLLKHIPGFAEKVGKDPERILEYILAKDYEGFLIYLM